MSYLNGRYVITFNGEIYNFLEIRADLEKEGYRFSSTSDTEVVLAAYDKWGPDMLSRFNGMWALAIWDHQKRRLFLSRDRYGIKPLLYRLTAQQLAFASELKAFRCLDGFQPELDHETGAFMQLAPSKIEGSARSLIKGVSRLPGGHYALISNGAMQIFRWWNTTDHLVTVPSSLEEQADMFQELFTESIRLRMRSDVPIGTCLSGGFDSTAVLCTLAKIGRHGAQTRAASDWQHAFVASFPGAVNDETPQAQEAARFAGVRPVLAPMREDEALNNIDRVLDDLDDVTISNATAVWLIYRELRQHRVVVSLDGHGADELLGGYRHTSSLLLSEAPSLLLHPLENFRRLRAAYRARASIMQAPSPLARMKYLARESLFHHPSLVGPQEFCRQSVRWARKVMGRPLSRFLLPDCRPKAGDFPIPAESDSLPDHWGSVNRDSYQIFHCTILPTILRNFDRLSMAHGIEVRMPFMDWHLVSFIMSLPDTSKVGGGRTKRVAREAMKGRMPESIRDQTLKIGFQSPLPEWLNGPLQDWGRDLVASQGWNHSFLNLRAFDHYFRQHCRQRTWTWSNCATAWTVLGYLWFEKNFLKR
jgi:asparagine synthase (glutamine-hydrolysing)